MSRFLRQDIQRRLLRLLTLKPFRLLPPHGPQAANDEPQCKPSLNHYNNRPVLILALIIFIMGPRHFVRCLPDLLLYPPIRLTAPLAPSAFNLQCSTLDPQSRLLRRRSLERTSMLTCQRPPQSPTNIEGMLSPPSAIGGVRVTLEILEGFDIDEPPRIPCQNRFLKCEAIICLADDTRSRKKIVDGTFAKVVGA
ncbi:predicted protein [Aspergillus nidulans FGSC A4]|uniref:Uncharacterized protein n=1 Tax=Emericella nidulans (strain FGSC A4 / ATCC 38163 / CBS 112.46 / NRRL 194 / M139) TaxID=227321 RepID=Q5BD81_EMENI|nr:hypothetical protein [Aspergillus nidulans FGSC A4]EAA63812.1 predicted protein [Aspergillus nidulans FGSC A4]CBF84991.1 TPA: hypothetical protein ANIA_01499 [Aspergillus nidulans FGSC A4]|eukprot:XP_659103.1 predicted protein [Aspergillus nidulans FGSC A4]